MKAIEMESSSKKLDTVLNLEAREATTEQAPFLGHVILKHLVLDNEGNVCLTSPTGLHGMLDAIDELKKELDDLANQAVLWLASSITLRRAKLAVVRMEEGDNNVGVSKGDGGHSNVGTPSPAKPEMTNVISLTRKTGERSEDQN